MSTYITNSARSPRLRRLMLTAVVAPTIVLGSSALVQPAFANAVLGRDWDIEAYDNCVKEGMAATHGNPKYRESLEYECCDRSGGVWKDGKCVAPPANNPNFPPPTQGPLPPGAVRPNPSGTDPGPNPGGKKPVNPPSGPAPINPNNSTGKQPSGGLQ
jgi:hypothetical protein